jgi:hypothetical protein
MGLASLIFNWQKWRFSAPQTHFTSWLLRGVVNQSLVLRINPPRRMVKIATFAKPETVWPNITKTVKIN